MKHWKIDADLIWAGLLLLLSAMTRPGRDGVIALFRNTFGGID